MAVILGFPYAGEKPGVSKAHRRKTLALRTFSNARKGARGGGGRHHGLLKHLSNDDLTLYHYREIRTAPAEKHLSVCRGCRDRLSAIALDPEALTPRSAGPSPKPPEKPRARIPLWRRLLFRGRTNS
jgi:hypothetical protein